MNLVIQEILTQILGFLILLFLLKRFAWKPLLTLLDERKRHITKEFERIESSKEEIRTLRTEYETKLTRIEDEARAKVKEAITDGQKLASQIQQKAHDDARTLLEKAKRNIEFEIAKAKIELKDEIADLAVNVSEKVLKEKLDERSHKELVGKFIDELEKAK